MGDVAERANRQSRQARRGVEQRLTDGGLQPPEGRASPDRTQETRRQRRVRTFRNRLTTSRVRSGRQDAVTRSSGRLRKGRRRDGAGRRPVDRARAPSTRSRRRRTCKARARSNPRSRRDWNEPPARRFSDRPVEPRPPWRARRCPRRSRSDPTFRSCRSCPKTCRSPPPRCQCRHPAAGCGEWKVVFDLAACHNQNGNGPGMGRAVPRRR